MPSNKEFLIFYSHTYSSYSSLVINFLNIDLGNVYPFCIFSRFNSPMSLLDLGSRQLIALKFFFYKSGQLCNSLSLSIGKGQHSTTSCEAELLK